MENYANRFLNATKSSASSTERLEVLADWQQTSQRSLRSQVEQCRRDQASCKLHLGAGDIRLEGWLNTDSVPKMPFVYYLDVTQPFPFGDSTVDFIFAEHMIEHMPLIRGEYLLRECFRVLKPGAVIRIATPDLQQFIRLYNSKEPDARSYVGWALEYNRLSHLGRPECLVINNFVRGWGHQFIYDYETLASLLVVTGFSSIVKCRTGLSARPDLCGLEHHGERIGVANNDFETMIVEANRD